MEFKTIKINDVEVRYPVDMDIKEAEAHLRDVMREGIKSQLSKLDIIVDEKNPSEAELKPSYDTIKRLRRITGYLSTEDKFNDGKKAELRNRKAQVEIE